MIEKPTPLVAATDLRKVFTRRGQTTVAVDDLNFTLDAGESLAIVGESGSGKSTVARLVMGMTAPTSGRIVLHGGRIPEGGRRTRARLARAAFIQMVFQDPYSSLDPRQRVGDCLVEALSLHDASPRAHLEERATELLEQVALAPTLARSYPRALSGGQRQRVAIARALAAEPQVLVLDEAVSALDVSVQARVLELLARIREERRLTLLFISHDLNVVREVSDRVLVMRQGQVVETGPTATVLDTPQHPYTRLLKASVPGPGWSPAEALEAIAAYRLDA